MATEWGERQPDGTVIVYRQNDDGTITRLRQESWEENQGIAKLGPARTPGLLPESMLPTSPMSMVGGLNQLASQQAILNQQYLRQRLQDLEMPQAQATLTGYVPNVWKRAQASGRYNTKTGPKTIQQMRAEIVAASKA